MKVVAAMAITRNVLALDVGDKRIGVAIASLDARIATALTFIEVEKCDVVKRIAELISDYEADILVVGLPRGLSGQETEQTKKVRKFVDELESGISIPIHLQDEAGTSLLAEKELQAKRKNYSRGDIDALSATLILDDWLGAYAPGNI